MVIGQLFIESLQDGFWVCTGFVFLSILAVALVLFYQRIWVVFMMYALPSQWNWFTRTVGSAWSRFWGQFKRRPSKAATEEVAALRKELEALKAQLPKKEGLP